MFRAKRGGWLTAENVRRFIFDLGYTQTYGSGLHYSYSEVLEMPFPEIIEFTRMLDEQRTREAKKMKR